MDTEGRWLTYGEIAAIRGTKRASAIKLAQRERWPKQAGNDRSQTVRVLVPGEWLVSARDQPAEAQDTAGGMSLGFANLLAEANKRADAALAVADQTMAALADANTRAAHAETRADELRAELERVRAAAQAAEEVLAEERQRADAAIVLASEATGANVELRSRLDALQRDLDAAHAAAQAAARQAAEELQRAEAERRARGLLARLRAAVRGQ